jgi:hypothetical protein
MSTSGIIPLRGASETAPVAIVAQTPRTKAAKPEEIYRAWLEIAEQRIGAEQTLIGGHTITASEAATGRDASPRCWRSSMAWPSSSSRASPMWASFRTTWLAMRGVGANSCVRLRQRSVAARDAPRYHQLTRALAAAEFLASEPIGNAEREEFALTDIGGDLDDSRRSVEVSANFLTRLAAPKATPNVAVTLRDANGDVCGEAVFAAPIAEANGQRNELFTATLAASRQIANVEVSLTRRPVG